MPKTLNELSDDYLFNTSIWWNENTNEVIACTIDDDVFESRWAQGWTLWSTWAGETDDEWISMSKEERYTRFLEEMLGLVFKARSPFTLMDVQRILCSTGFYRAERAFLAQDIRRENWPTGQKPRAAKVDFESHLSSPFRKNSRLQFKENKKLKTQLGAIEKRGA